MLSEMCALSSILVCYAMFLQYSLDCHRAVCRDIEVDLHLCTDVLI